jgi:ketosteroid isomerase-like protein
VCAGVAHLDDETRNECRGVDKIAWARLCGGVGAEQGEGESGEEDAHDHLVLAAPVKSGNGQRRVRFRRTIERDFSWSAQMTLTTQARGAAVALATLLAAGAANATPDQDRANVAALDTAYQAAVERNDAQAMAAILHDDMILVVGAGAVYTRQQLLDSARNQDAIYEHQVEDPGTQTVRLYGADTAVVTARLWLKGRYRESGQAFDRTLWFSDTYVRTPQGWRYAFGQSSIALPNPPQR